MGFSVINEIDFAFCPRCGAQFTKSSDKHLACASCNLEYYINPRPCNAIVIENESHEILLVRRAFDPSKDLWDLPGGFTDIGESAEESVVREAREELGVHLTNLKYLFSGGDRYEFSGLRYHTLGFVFSATIDSGELRPHDDVAGIRFFRKDAIPWEELSFPSIEKTLRAYTQTH